jgi:hypothetical protein
VTTLRDPIRFKTDFKGDDADQQKWNYRLLADWMEGPNFTDLTVGTAEIEDGSITTAKIADAAITTAKVGTAQITTATIADAAITTAKIVDANITSAKIASLAVTNAKINDLDVGKLTAGTMSADVTISGSIKTASSGKRVVIDSGGIILKDASNNTTADLDTATGNVTIVGTYSTAFSGNRIEIDSGSDQDKIKFVANDGTSCSLSASKGAFPSGGSQVNQVELHSGDFVWSSTKTSRLTSGYMILDTVSAPGAGSIGNTNAALFVQSAGSGTKVKLSVRFGKGGTIDLATSN